jgi:hypothetical protein
MADEILQILTPSTPTRAEGQYLNHDGMNLPVCEDADRIQRRMSAESGDDKLKTQTTKAGPAGWSDNSDSPSMSRRRCAECRAKTVPASKVKTDSKAMTESEGAMMAEQTTNGGAAGPHTLPHQPPILEIDDDRST